MGALSFDGMKSLNFSCRCDMGVDTGLRRGIEGTLLVSVELCGRPIRTFLPLVLDGYWRSDTMHGSKQFSWRRCSCVQDPSRASRCLNNSHAPI